MLTYQMDMIVAFVGPLFLGLLIGTPLILWGFRGRIVGEDNHCLKCGYNLFASVPTTYSCPECGADITSKNGIQRGVHKNIWLLIISGLIIIGSAIGGGGWKAWERADALGYRIVPTWWLIRQAKERSYQWEIFDELSRRLEDGGLGKTQVIQLVDHVLALQVDQHLVWLPEWGEFVELSKTQGELDEGRWRIYLEQACRFELQVPRRARPGDKLPLLLTYSGRAGRVGQASAMSVHFEGIRLRVAGEEIYISKYGGSHPVDNVADHVPAGNVYLPHELQTGHDQPVELDLLVSVNDEFHLSRSGSRIHSWNVRLESSVSLVSEYGPTAALRGEHEIEAILRQELLVGRWTKRTQQIPLGGTRIYYVGFAITLPPLSVGVAYDVILRSGEREWVTDPSLVNLAGPGNVFTFTVRGDSVVLGMLADCRVIDIILRPTASTSGALAERSEAYTKEIVLERMPIDWTFDP